MTINRPTFSTLYNNRSRPPLFSREWYKAWLKRTYHIKALIRLLIASKLLRIRGANVGSLCAIETNRIYGKISSLSIGDNCYIGKDCHLSLHNDINIGNNVVINEGVRILTGSHRTDTSEWELKTRAVRIKDNAWVAVGAIILPGVEIGFGAVVGAGAVVRSSVPDRAIVCGNPARTVGTRFQGEFNYHPTSNTAPFEAWLGSRSIDSQ